MITLTNKKFTLIVSGLLVVILILLGILLWPPSANHRLEVIFLDVGQGDSELIKTPSGQKVLIDGGPDNSVIKKLGKYLSFFDREIDLVILTHPHADHVTGLVEVLRRYQVKKVLATGMVYNEPAYLTFLQEIKDKNIPFEAIKSRQEIGLGDQLKLELFYPSNDLTGQKLALGPGPVALGKKINNTSIVAKLIFGYNSFLFTGDIEEEVEHQLLAESVDLKANVLKVAHHGSDSSSTEGFLKAVDPAWAVIEVGAGNRFNLPDYRIVKRLERRGARVFRTDQVGDVRLLSDGWSISREEN